MARRWELRLANNVSTLNLNREVGIVPQRFDRGHPTIRSIQEVRPDTNGSIDGTQLYGARTVTASFGLAWEVTNGDADSDTDLEDLLMAWMDPSLRYFLEYREIRHGQWRRFHVRPDNKSNPINLTFNEFPIVILQWNAFEGVAESLDEVLATITASTEGELGRSYDLTFDRSYPASPVIGESPVFNLGTAQVLPKARIYGPCTGPKLINLTQGKGLYFDDAYEVLAGEWLEIDFRAGTILLNGSPLNSRYNKLNFLISDWWTLGAGQNDIKFQPELSSYPSRAELRYHHTYL